MRQAIVVYARLLHLEAYSLNGCEFLVGQVQNEPTSGCSAVWHNERHYPPHLESSSSTSSRLRCAYCTDDGEEPVAVGAEEISGDDDEDEAMVGSQT